MDCLGLNGSLNTDGVMPTIDFAEVTKDFIFRYPNDYIVAYTTNSTTEPVTITYGWQNEDHHFMLDFFSGGDRAHAKKFLEEARRVMHGHRFDTFGDSENELTGRHWLHYAAYTQPMDIINKQFYRRKVESVLHIRFRRIVA